MGGTRGGGGGGGGRGYRGNGGGGSSGRGETELKSGGHENGDSKASARCRAILQNSAVMHMNVEC